MGSITEYLFMRVTQKFHVGVSPDFPAFVFAGLFFLSLGSTLGMLFGEAVQAGTIEGTVHYLGPKPPPKILPVTRDQDHCGTEVRIQTIHLHDAHGALSDAVVSVQDMEEQSDGTKIQGLILNMRCAFSPRIGTARKGQKIEIRNQDPILHNTHIKYVKRTFLNVAQVPGGKPIVKRLKRAGLHDFRCDKHVFMEGYLHVFSHPFYAVTNQTGTFRITEVPAGDHHIQVWHETLGLLDQLVSVPQNGTVQLNFTYP